MRLSIYPSMRACSWLPPLLVLLTTISLTLSLPAPEAVESIPWRQPSSTLSSRVSQKAPMMNHDTAARAHLYKRKAEIYELEKRQQINCTNPNALFFEECWAILEIQNYLVAPNTGWINTIRYCQNTGGNTWDNDGSNCCVPGEAWSTCYLRMAIPGSSHDCTSASGGRCSESMVDDIEVAPEIYPYVRYTVKNIYGTSPWLPIFSLDRQADT